VCVQPEDEKSSGGVALSKREDVLTGRQNICGFGAEELSSMKKLILSIVILTLFPIAGFSQAAAPNGWNDPFPPHKVMDNFYYVGTKELASFLIVTPEGNILMNSNYEASVLLIRASVEKLGFKFSDIKILIAGQRIRTTLKAMLW